VCAKIMLTAFLAGMTYFFMLLFWILLSKACTVFAHPEAGTVGSNPTQGMDV
jgi:hypothetical protein